MFGASERVVGAISACGAGYGADFWLFWLFLGRIREFLVFRVIGGFFFFFLIFQRRYFASLSAHFRNNWAVLGNLRVFLQILSNFECLDENQRKSTKINENHRKSTSIDGNRRKSTKIYESQRRSTKAWKINENRKLERTFKPAVKCMCS